MSQGSFSSTALRQHHTDTTTMMRLSQRWSQTAGLPLNRHRQKEPYGSAAAQLHTLVSKRCEIQPQDVQTVCKVEKRRQGEGMHRLGLVRTGHFHDKRKHLPSSRSIHEIPACHIHARRTRPRTMRNAAMASGGRSLVQACCTPHSPPPLPMSPPAVHCGVSPNLKLVLVPNCAHSRPRGTDQSSSGPRGTDQSSSGPRGTDQSSSGPRGTDHQSWSAPRLSPAKTHVSLHLVRNVAGEDMAHERGLACARRPGAGQVNVASACGRLCRVAQRGTAWRLHSVAKASTFSGVGCPPSNDASHAQ
jgi:hypothetical protein